MSDNSNNFWKWAAGILGTIISGVVVHYLTKGINPDKNPVIQSIPTPNKPKLSEQPVPTPTILNEQPVLSTSTSLPNVSPEKEVNSYFNDINGGRYQAAWDRLPTAIQENENMHPNGFKSFEEWYESMNSVDVKEVNVAESNSESAEVNTRIAYNFDNKAVSSSLRFLLSWDSQAEKWRITEIKKN
ncbi:MAG: hypothetical protein AAF378_20605 [Cyanobacteria bacterium P01_A01_bin.84]